MNEIIKIKSLANLIKERKIVIFYNMIKVQHGSMVVLNTWGKYLIDHKTVYNDTVVKR